MEEKYLCGPECRDLDLTVDQVSLRQNHFKLTILKIEFIENINISCSISFPIDSSNTEFAYYGPILVNCFVSVCQSEKNGGNLVGLVNQLMTF